MINLTRTYGATDLNAKVGVGAAIPTNDFDNVYPWKDIELLEPDENGNVFVRIPKFYTKYDIDSNGNITGRHISEYLIDEKEGWFLNPVFKSGDKELGYVDIAAYLLGLESGKVYSRSGDEPLRGKSIATIEEMVESYDNNVYDYSLIDVYALQMLQDLFAIEYATTSCQEIMKGYTYTNYSGGLLANGATDSVVYHTGYANEDLNEGGRNAMKYRFIENLWGNGFTFIDGIRFNKTVISLAENGEYKEVDTISKPMIDGTLYKLKFDEASKLCFPSAVNDQGGYANTYIAGSPSRMTVLYNGYNSDNCGLFSYNTDTSLTSVPSLCTFRMMRKQK